MAILGLGATLLLQARVKFTEQLEQGGVNQVKTVHHYLASLYEEVEARGAGRGGSRVPWRGDGQRVCS